MFKSMMTSIVTKTMAKKLKNATINEDDIKDLIREIRISLIDADVNLQVVKTFINKIKEKTINQTIDQNISPSDFVIKVIKDELIEILGKDQKSINFNSNKKIKIMMVGLQGSGKTTSCAKLANYAKTKFNRSPLLVACDVYRPAAIDQLKTLANENNISFYDRGLENPIKTVDLALDLSKKNNNDLIIIDTAGRLQTNEELMQELVEMKKKLDPDYIILVVDAMSGQDIVNVAQEFNNRLKLSGLFITKLDSDARAGAVLSLISILNIPVMYTGIGEKINAIELFYPERIADRILGLGDIATLAEKAVEAIDEKRIKGQLQRILSGKMDLEDLLVQMEQIGKMGSVGGIMSMLPGMGNKLSEEKEVEIEKRMKVMKVLMSSMTLKERRNPKLLKRDATRRLRIVKGSGRKMDELNKLLKQWEEGNKKMSSIGGMIKQGKNPFNNFKK